MQSSFQNTWREQAQSAIAYYQPLAEELGSVWTLGLFMAYQWMRLIDQALPNASEILLFVQALESQRMSQGSGWHDMTIRVKRWAETEHELEMR